jgi:hypothetical protein
LDALGVDDPAAEEQDERWPKLQLLPVGLENQEI